MQVFDELRPVEALYLMSYADLEEWSSENALAAVLVYLSIHGYIEAHKKKFQLTAKGEEALTSEDILWDYETQFLQTIKDKDPEEMVDMIESLDFKGSCLEANYFTKVKAKFLWIIPYKKTEFSEDGQRLVEKLVEAREKINLAFKDKTLTKEGIVNSYAFPSLAMSNGFKKYATKVVADVEEAAAIRTAMLAATTTIVLCASINNMAAMNMCSASSISCGS
jgi:hypothetical protein